MFFSNLYISWQTVLKILKNISQFLTADINTGILQKKVNLVLKQLAELGYYCQAQFQ